MLRTASASAEFSAHRFTWMARANHGTEDFTVEGTVLSEPGSQGQRDLARYRMTPVVDVDAFDAVVFVGVSPSTVELARLTNNYMVPEWFGEDVVESVVAGEASRWLRTQLISETAFHAAVCCAIRESLSHRWIKQLEANTRTRFFIVPPPFPRETIVLPDATRHRVFQVIAEFEVFDRMRAAYSAAFSDVFAEFESVTVVLQDPSTVANDLFTKEVFCRDAVRIDFQSKHDATDYMHANGAFGRIVLDEVLRAA
ncbi:MAG: hypothetical protein AAF479_17470 [Pseudomonadota bacterium]